MPLADMINLVSQVSRMNREADAQALAEQQGRTGAFQTFGTMAEHIIDPQLRTKFIESYAQNSGLDKGALTEYAKGIIPTTQQLNAYGQSQHIMGALGAFQAVGGEPSPEAAQYFGQQAAAATGQGVGDAAKQEAVKSAVQGQPNVAQTAGVVGATGMAPGQMSLDEALKNMTPGELAHFQKIGHGTELNAGEQQSGQIQREGQGLQAGIAANEANYRNRALGQQYELGVAGMDNRLAVAAQRQQQAHDQSEAARKRLQANAEFLAKNATTSAGGKIMTQQMQEDYDFLHGNGAWAKDYGQNVQLTPGIAHRILVKIGG